MAKPVCATPSWNIWYVPTVRTRALPLERVCTLLRMICISHPLFVNAMAMPPLDTTIR
jgi:hypothetical protein